MARKITTLFIFLLILLNVQAQDTLAPFWRDIQNFKQHDSAGFPPKQAILFTGSSSFTKWVDVQDYFPGHIIINRGFGGSSLPHLIRYADEIIIPYQPVQILVYCGENDMASSDSITGQIVFNRFKQLYQLIRSSLPQVHIAYVSMKPSPSREKFWPEMVKGNSLIKNYLKAKKRTAFIDVYHKMFNKDGTVMKDIFIGDNLHMNAKGYVIWQKAIAPYLLPTRSARPAAVAKKEKIKK
ncbi:MAG: GDSL-type esterase/lipase family protein [Ferruginibacter sp.]